MKELKDRNSQSFRWEVWKTLLLPTKKIAPHIRKVRGRSFLIGKLNSICTVCSASTMKRLIITAILMLSGHTRWT